MCAKIKNQKTLQFLPALVRNELNSSLLDPVEYRKSGLSLNHIIGCPLDCSYCVRHLFKNFEMKTPHLLVSDQEAVNYLINHKYFQPDITPLQLFNRATDPFLPSVKPHMFAVAEDLDKRGLTNHLLIITRYKITADDCDRFNNIKNLKITLLVTYSGIQDKRVEPIDSNIAVESLKTAFLSAKNYRVIFYWRPLIPGLNDSDHCLSLGVSLSQHAHATVFTGLFYRKEIQAFFKSNGISEPYTEVARRKILPEQLECRLLRAFHDSGSLTPVFRKTSCAVAFVHGKADYNGHFGIKELCDICPAEQIRRCRDAWVTPNAKVVSDLALQLGAKSLPVIDSGAIQVEGLDEPRRYFIQHSLGYQVHDLKFPHKYRQHGRASIGWKISH